MGPPVRRDRQQIRIFKFDTPLTRPHEAHDGTHQRCFAGPVPNDPDLAQLFSQLLALAAHDILGNFVLLSLEMLRAHAIELKAITH